MRKMSRKHFFLLIALCTAISLFMTSCKDKDVSSGYAPSSVAGKTITINGTSAGVIHIAFPSNNSARITRNDGSSLTFSSISYSRTSSTAATIHINGIYIDFGSSSAKDDENLSLIFTSTNQGIVNGSYVRRWNDGSIMNGSIEYQSFTIF